MMTPLVSIVIPVFNAGEYLCECLDSVLGQNIDAIEVICVDDGSTDSSQIILDKYSRADSRVKVVRVEHSNAGYCRNIGMSMATGKWLSFLDADDVFDIGMLSRMVAEGDAKNADVVTCGFFRFYDGDDYLKRFVRTRDVAKIYNSADESNPFAEWVGWAWDKVFRREFVQLYGLEFQSIVNSNDMRFVYSALSLANKVVKINDKFVAHRMHWRSLQETRNKSPDCFITALNSLDDVFSKSGAYNKNVSLRDNFRNFILNQGLWQLNSVGSLAAHRKIRPSISDLYEKHGIFSFVNSRKGLIHRIRLWAIKQDSILEDLYYICWGGISTNSKFRAFLKKFFCKRV